MLSLSRRRLTVREFERMTEMGILNEDDRLELIDGEIIEMTPIGRRHAACVDRLTQLFAESFGRTVQLRVQSPVVIGEHDEVQPDVALLRPRSDFYATTQPTGEDVFLIVEVADSSFDLDRMVKLPRCAQGGITEAWLVDLNGDVVMVGREPGPDGYRLSRVARRGEDLTVASFPDHLFAVEDVLGPKDSR